MKYSKKQIVLSIVPIFVVSGCSNDDEQATRYAAPNIDSRTVENSDGSLSTWTEADEQIFTSYEDAKRNGYQGSFDEWVELTELYPGNPELAEQRAEDAGFHGGHAMLAAATGLALGALAMNAMAGRSGVSYDSYTQQRMKQRAYAAQMRKRDDESSSSSSGRGGGGGFFSKVTRNGFGGAVSSGG